VLVVNAKGFGHPELGEWCGRFPMRVCATGAPLARSRAANLGLDNAHGEYLIFLDDDDWFLPDHIMQLVQALKNNPRARVAYTGVKCVRKVQGSEWEQVYVFNESFNATRLLCENYLPIHAVLFSRRLLEEGCRFDEGLDIYEDWDFWIQASLISEFMHVDRVNAVYRISDSGGFGVTGDQDTIAQSLARLFDKWKHLWNEKQVVALMDLAKSGYRSSPLIEENTRQAQQLERQRVLIEKATELENSLKQDVVARDVQIANIYRSNSWRLTRPLRALRRLVDSHRASAALHYAHGSVHGDTRHQGLSWFDRRAISIYRAIPIAPATKQRLKDIVFRIFGSAFVRFDSYQRWKAHRQSQTTWLSAGSIAPVLPGAITALPSADGTWDWADYSVVKSRITEVKADRRSQAAPSSWHLIDIGSESFVTAAARVNFPPLVSAPDVSIIIPAFNNLKLTIECLLSISEYTNSGVSYEIIVADDASIDETAQVIGSIQNLRVLRNKYNLGFLRNCNHALEHAKGKYVLYLNNDVQVADQNIAVA